MKKTIMLLTILSTSITIAVAQKLNANKFIKASHYTYKTDSLMFGNIYARNENNIYHNPNKKSINSDIVDGNLTKDKTATINAFKKVFGTDKLRQLLKEGSMIIEYIVADNGKILEVSFTLNHDTLITATELEQLEDIFKNELSFKWSIPHKKVNGFYIITQVIRFNKILDGTIGG